MINPFSVRLVRSVAGSSNAIEVLVPQYGKRWIFIGVNLIVS